MHEHDRSTAAAQAAITPVPAESPSATERFHALDAVRGFALMLGIVFHSTMSFLNGPQQMWLVVDKSPSTTLTVMFFTLHMFRMVMFFFIAGFFAHLLFHRRGERAFVRDRLRRIGLPLIVGWPFLIAALVAGAIWGAWVMNGGQLPAEPPADPNAPPLAFPLTHLWFLYVLLWLYGITLLVRRVVVRFDADGRRRARLDWLVGTLVRNPLSVVALAVPTWAGLMAFPVWMPWLGIPTPDTSLLPNIAAFTAFGSAFAFGWLVHRQTDLLNTFEARWPLHLLVAVLTTIGCLWHIGTTANIDIAPREAATLIYAAGYALAVWSWTLAMVGLALRFLAGFSAARRYVADASYWLYLIHLPIVLALQILLSQAAWPWWVKFPLILAIGFPIMFASYHYLVRGTFIGAVLNGRRHPRTLNASNEVHRAPTMEGSR